MIFVIQTAREIHNCRTLDEFSLRHAEAIAAKQRRGERVELHRSVAPKVAYIDRGQWVIRCDCGAGNTFDPEWADGLALCFGCGAQHVNVTLPSTQDRATLERLLLARPESKTRNWTSRETMEEIEAENEAHGMNT